MSYTRTHTHTQQVSGDTAVSTIKSLVASELSVGPGSQVTFNGRPLADTTTLAGAGVGDQDLLLMTMGGGGAFGVASGAASVSRDGVPYLLLQP